MPATTQSNLPTVQRLKYEDFADAGSWQKAIALLVDALNLFLTPVYNILNGGVAYQNLVAPQVYTTSFTGGQTPPTFKNPLAINPNSVIIGNVWSVITSTHPAVAVQCFWHVSGNTIVIDSIVGLTSGTVYTITFVVN